MSRNILQQLFEGNIHPSEDICKDNSVYGKLVLSLSDEKARLLENLSDENRIQFQNVEDKHYEASEMYGYECFAYGFRLSAAIIIESLKGTIKDNTAPINE